MSETRSPTTKAPASFWTGALRRQAAMVVTLVLLCAGAGLGYAIVLGTEFTSTGRVLLNPLENNPYEPGSGLETVLTEATLVPTDPMAERAKPALGRMLGGEELREQIEVEVPSNTQVIEVSFTANNRQDARNGARAFTEGFLAFRKEQTEKWQQGQLDRLQRQQRAASDRVRDAQDEVDSAVSESEQQQAEENLEEAESELEAIGVDLAEVRSIGTDPGQVITRATLPPVAGLRYILLFGGGGAFAGLLFGLLLAIARARADDRIHQPADVEHVGVPVLGVADPRYGIAARRGQGGAAGRVPELPEAYRALRTATVTSAQQPPVSIALLAASPSVTTAPETAGLAVGLARAGFRVTVIDTLGETGWLLGGRGHLRGLGELLIEGVELERVLVRPEERLAVLPLGRAHPQTMDRLLSPMMRQTVSTLAAHSDYVLLAGSTAIGSDGRALAALADDVLLVANRGVTTRASLTEAAEAVRRVGAGLLGAALVEAGSQEGLLRQLNPFRRVRERPAPAFSGYTEQRTPEGRALEPRSDPRVEVEVRTPDSRGDRRGDPRTEARTPEARAADPRAPDPRARETRVPMHPTYDRSDPSYDRSEQAYDWSEGADGGTGTSAYPGWPPDGNRAP